MAARPFAVSVLALLAALAADNFLPPTDLEALDLPVFAVIVAGRLAVVADFFAAALVLAVVFWATRLALLTAFLAAEVEDLKTGAPLPKKKTSKNRK